LHLLVDKLLHSSTAGLAVILSGDIGQVIATIGTKKTAAAEGAVTQSDKMMAYVKQLVTQLLATEASQATHRTALTNHESSQSTHRGNYTPTRAGYLDNINNSNLSTIKDISDLTNTIIGYINNTNLSTIGNISSLDSTKIGYLANLSAGAVALEATLTAIKGGGWSDETLKAIKDAVDAIATDGVPTSSDWKGNFTWDTSAYTTNEQDISALFSTNLALDVRRKYTVYLDLTTVEADASFDELYLAVKKKIDGSNYRAIDRKTVTKAQIAATAEPGIIIDIPATSENIQITMQMKTALAGDATIYYAVVKEHLE